MNPQYPVYIVSKGRWERRLTSRAFETMKVPYHIVVEPQEYDRYAEVIDPEKILTLPFSNLGQGSIPARNWIWEHAISTGAERHWVVDDNIGSFKRFNNNKKLVVMSGTILKVMEDFVDRYTNVALAGPNYIFFAPATEQLPHYYLNTRIYSCILIKNDLPYRWRGKYNEDTDLSLRALKDGWCTILFNAFLINKSTTMKMKGGNTDELYKGGNQGDGRKAMTLSLIEQHPDVVTGKERFGRWHHVVDYTPFKNNKLIRKDGIVIPETPNDYGMKLVDFGVKNKPIWKSPTPSREMESV